MVARIPIIERMRNLLRQVLRILFNHISKVDEYFFHESRFPIVEQRLSPENAQNFRELPKEDKALFINYLIEIGV